MKTLKFAPPIRGLSGLFNTFRLGDIAGRFAPGDVVKLVKGRVPELLLEATVDRVIVGTLGQMALVHAEHAHNWKEHPADQRPDLLKASMKSRYKPGMVTDTSVVTVIYLKGEPHDLSEPRIESPHLPV